MRLQWLLKRLDSRVIAASCPDGTMGPPLMTRYFLVRRTRWGVFLHHFHRSDVDILHDHPWTFITLLLSGGYWETTDRGRFWRRRFILLYRPATYRHFIEVERPVWTLVVRFRRQREWGFWLPGGWRAWYRAGIDVIRHLCNDQTELPQPPAAQHEEL